MKRNRNWLSLILLTLVVLLPSSAYSETEKSPKFVLFLIHGLGGSAGTFCDLKDILERDYSGEVAVESIEYLTNGKEGVSRDHHLHEDNIKVVHFVQSVHDQIEAFYTKKKIPLSTPFGFVMHSQGGVVGLRYAAKCVRYASTSRECREGPKNLSLFITYGTPFWGSPTASKLKDYWFIKFAAQAAQLKELAYGSMTDTTNRLFLYNNFRWDGSGKSKIFSDNVKVINVSGEASGLGAMSKVQKWLNGESTSDDQIAENDLVVTNTSARMDFIHYIEERDGEVKSGVTRMADDYYAIPWPHVEVPKSKSGLICIKDQGIDPKGLKYNRKNYSPYVILSSAVNEQLGLSMATQNSQLREQPRFVKALRDFLSEVKLMVPLEVNYKVDLKDEYVTVTSASANVKEAAVEGGIAAKTSGFNDADLDQKQVKYLTYFNEGTFKRGSGAKARDQFKPRSKGKVRYTFRIPGFEPLNYVAEVMPSYSTFSMLPLRPFIPYQPVQHEPGRLLKDGSEVLSISLTERDGLGSEKPPT